MSSRAQAKGLVRLPDVDLREMVAARFAGRPEGAPTLGQVAAMVGCTPTHLAGVLDGTRAASPVLARKIAEQVSYPGHWVRVHDLFE